MNSAKYACRSLAMAASIVLASLPNAVLAQTGAISGTVWSRPTSGPIGVRSSGFRPMGERYAPIHCDASGWNGYA